MKALRDFFKKEKNISKEISIFQLLKLGINRR